MTQKDSTSDIETRSPKKVNRRSKEKYPALKKRYNLKMRQDYIEPDYVNGVIDKDGNQVIRALNAEEKRFLNSFYEEVIGANFMHDKELKALHRKIKSIKDIENPTDDNVAELSKLQSEYFGIANDVLLYPKHEDQKKLYGENNSRNRCIYNRTKSIGILDELNDGTYDEFHKNAYNTPGSGELLMINKIETKTKTILRKKKKDK